MTVGDARTQVTIPALMIDIADGVKLDAAFAAKVRKLLSTNKL